MGGLSCLLLLCWLGKITGNDGKPMSIEVLGVFTLMWALVMVGLVKSLGFLKRVEVDDHALYVSNHLTEVRIPLSEITDVRETGGSKSLTRVSISFRHSSPFGKSIEFLPRLSLHLSADPVVREVQALRKQASAVERSWHRHALRPGREDLRGWRRLRAGRQGLSSLRLRRQR